jgi:hypothetical protein
MWVHMQSCNTTETHVYLLGSMNMKKHQLDDFIEAANFKIEVW